MKLDKYQKDAEKTDFSSRKIKSKWISLLSLYNEVGDLIEVFKKRLEMGKFETYKIEISEEIGDILWYVSIIAGKFNFKLSDIALYNLTINYNEWLKRKMSNKLAHNLTFDQYQTKALKTDLSKHKKGQLRKMVMFPLLGLAGEVGDLLSTYKKRLAPGNNKIFEREVIKKELGDILWYLSNIASKLNLKLGKIACQNLIKAKARCTTGPLGFFDAKCPLYEQIPRKFYIYFDEIDYQGEKPIVKIFIKDSLNNNFYIGERLTDNSHKDDGYRFHDIFHLAYAAKLGWSPVTRALLKRKRKGDPSKDEVEDGGRAIVLEEAISAYIFNEAEKVKFFEDTLVIDYSLLKTIRSLAAGLEIKNCTPKLWEEAILDGFKIFRQLVAKRGGKVMVDLLNRQIEYINS